MDQLVLHRRHRPAAGCFDDVAEVGVLRALPLAEVQRRAAVYHVLVGKPRERSDVRVPRPFRQVGMTVEASSLSEAARLRAVPGRLPDDKWLVWLRPYGMTWTSAKRTTAPIPIHSSHRLMPG